MGTLSGGEKLDAALAALAHKLGKGGAVKVGFLEGATYPDGTSVALVAATQNFGAPGRGIPPRPFFSNMIRKNRHAWAPLLAYLLKQNGGDVPAALAIMGQKIAGDLAQEIVLTNSPALSEITLMLRKMKAQDPDLEVTGATVGEAARRVAADESTAGVSTKPLIESAHMLQSISYEVEE